MSHPSLTAPFLKPILCLARKPTSLSQELSVLAPVQNAAVTDSSGVLKILNQSATPIIVVVIQDYSLTQLKTLNFTEIKPELGENFSVLYVGEDREVLDFQDLDSLGLDETIDSRKPQADIFKKIKSYYKLTHRFSQNLVQTRAREKAAISDLQLKSLALENSLNGFDIVNEEGKFIYANKAYLSMWGYDSLEDLFQSEPSQHCADPEIPGLIIKSLKESGTCDIEFHARRKDGRLFQVRMLAYLAYDADGKEIYPTTSIDISEQYKAHQATLDSEAYFKSMIDTSPAMVWVTDENSNCIYLSQKWYDYTGRTPAQDLGVGWLDNIHRDDFSETARVYANAVEAKGLLQVEYRLRDRDGNYRWMIDIGNPRFYSNGDFAGYIGTVTDIHDRLMAEKKLSLETERFIRSAEASDLGVWYCDLPFDFLEWTPVVKKHFFLAPDERVSIERFYEIIHPEDRELTRSAINSSIENRTAYDVYYRTVNPKNPQQMKWIRALGWCDYDEAGNPVRFDGVTLDSTRDFTYQEDLRRARDEAERANHLKSVFLANMSHEIRTPLGAILGFSELMRDPDCSEGDRNNYLDIIARNGEQLSVIVNDILDLSKVEAGRMQFEYLTSSPYQLALDVASLLNMKALEKGLQVSVLKEPSCPAVVQLDPYRCRQILTNLIGNAIKFTHKGSIQLKISTNFDEQRPRLVYSVLDTGIGIEKEKWEEVFEVFVQADGSMTRKFGGTGLGLALSRKLAREMGGEIYISESQVGLGTHFSFEVPMR